MSDKSRSCSSETARTGTLIIIGGHEDKSGTKEILSEVARRTGSGTLIIATVASHEPDGYFEPYRQAFHELGVRDVVELTLDDRSEAFEERNCKLLEEASGIFFTGGDQLRLTSQIGDTPIFRQALELFEKGGVVAGTSAGASAMCETMLISGPSEESHRIGDLRMAPGFGLMRNVIIDQHFAERGRMGRLLGAVAQNPRMIGIGIDEDTAILVESPQRSFEVMGSGAVYVVDGSSVTHSNLADEDPGATLAIFNVTLHVLTNTDRYCLDKRKPEARRSGR